MEKISHEHLNKLCVYDRAGDKIFLAFKDENGHIITGYFILCEDLDKQINFLKVKSRGNVLMIPHDRILKIKLKEEGNGY